ncbi:HI1506-related protein [Thiomicrorhabdus indica]|uniref:HI1506-related protein n=1 Tax=Thiomicrorhabdus indica TaxID=2267253 RepID=UPI002AA82B08|nr:HI1506-related protein [Thiomicrorhabdus indica]
MAKVTITLTDKSLMSFRRAGITVKKGEALDVEVSDKQLEALQKEPKLNVRLFKQDQSPADGADDDSRSIFEAIGQLDPENPEHFTKSGKPELKALRALFGIELTAEQRDQVWADYQASQGGEG